mmetsp:Transcript_100850/g.289893  ORF Transcript_100850/g.289893 Transcript_100850/m.289893 type:complete len:220 (+) Transcript_100850:127-786(+)
MFPMHAAAATFPLPRRACIRRFANSLIHRRSFCKSSRHYRKMWNVCERRGRTRLKMRCTACKPTRGSGTCVRCENLRGTGLSWKSYRFCRRSHAHDKDLRTKRSRASAQQWKPHVARLPPSPRRCGEPRSRLSDLASLVSRRTSRMTVRRCRGPLRSCMIQRRNLDRRRMPCGRSAAISRRWSRTSGRGRPSSPASPMSCAQSRLKPSSGSPTWTTNSG